MSMPKKPDASESPIREQRSPYKSRRAAPDDVETGYFSPLREHRRHKSGSKHGRETSKSSIKDPMRSSARPTTPTSNDRVPLARSPSPEVQRTVSRKRSLIRPERSRIDRDHPNYYYRQHAANMEILPSSTGHDPILEDEVEMEPSESTQLRDPTIEPLNSSPRRLGKDQASSDYEHEKKLRPHHKLERERTIKATKTQRDRQGELDALKPPSLWNVYCAIVTFWCPDFVMKCCGMPAKAQRRAWREKMGLISIIIVMMGFVGFITFGFTQVVCGVPPLRLRINQVDHGYMILHGTAYDLSLSSHPAAYGIPDRSNVVYPPLNLGGYDGSFLFQNVNGKCKGLITAANGSDVPTNSDGDLAYYFPCNAFKQDGSSSANETQGPYNGYACHTSATARHVFYKELNAYGEVYFTWDDIKNSSRNLAVYSGSVLDLNLLKWFNTTQVNVPAVFAQLSDTNNQLNQAVRGRDITHAFQSAGDQKMGQCLEEIIKVGSVDTETVGCIASKVVLYVSLIFILSIVVSKFILALVFQWFICRKYAATKTSQSSNYKKRNRQIEDWSDDIYRAPQRLAGDIGSTVVSSDRTSKRASTFLPTTSRFTSPYAGDRSSFARPMPTTMASQGSTTHLLAPNPMFRQQNDSRLSFARTDTNTLSGYDGTMNDLEGPAGFIHEFVVPQPPADWQPWGFPLIHTLCLVTAYSEGEAGIRSTLDSIAMTDYPNSHKTIFVICDGLIKGKGETQTTPDIVLGMMKDFATLPDEVPAFSYVAVSSGAKRHNMAKVYSGFYDYGENSGIPVDKQQRVPMMCIVKCGTPDEAKKSKPGNRGKRDSQIILMSFLQKTMFDERMTELEFDISDKLWRITGVNPDWYETVLMVDADTKVFPDSITHMVSAMVKDPQIMGLCGETKIANKRATWVSAIQVFEYFISHHLQKSFESVFGGVTCLPGCFSMYRIKAPKGGQDYWVPILANPDIVEHYSENVVETLHDKNLLLLGEDRYLSTLMLRTFPKRKQVFIPQAVCKTTVPEEFSVLLSQRRRWINSTIHNLMELVLVRDLCGTFCFSMQFFVFVDLVGTLVLPAAIGFTIYLVIISIIRTPVQVIPLVLLAVVLGLPGVLIVLTAHRWSYVAWMMIYLGSLPIWNGVLPLYAFWKFDDFSWGDTRKTAGERTKKAGLEYEGEFDSSKITMKRRAEFAAERKMRDDTAWSNGDGYGDYDNNEH
ncbi:MAG: Chitin synthase, class 3 [Claussenomyces sp. TS43310]|nr:MAG: Chitin synthase, class 3 [Claussenomyces sp. TS43310]